MPSTFNVNAYIDRLRTILRPLQFTENILGTVGDYPVSAWTRPALDPETKEPIEPVAHIYISGGVHGDEPSGPLAITRILQQFVLSTSVSWHLLPLINPNGMEKGTRENAESIDINRDFLNQETPEAQLVCDFLEQNKPASGYDLTLCIHEDYEAQGCYLYQLDETELAESLAKKILESASEFIPVEVSPEIDGHTAREGLITPLIDRPEDIKDMDMLPEAVLLFKTATRRSYTIETPSSAYIEHRVAAQAAAIRTAVAQVLRTL